jgi:signal transduction histidine kinase
MIYFEIRNKQDRVLASNLESCPGEIIDSLVSKEKENVRVRNVRNAFRESEDAEIRLVIVEDKELANSTRGISRVANTYLSLVPQFQEIERRQRQHFDVIIGRFAHNLVDIDRKVKGHLERLAPDTLREKTYADFRDIVEERIKNNTQSDANDICQIAHRATDLEAQIAGLRVISGLADEIAPSLIDANILRTLRRLQQPFLSELEKKHIHIDNRIDMGEADRRKVRIDPQLLNVALSQFFNNAVKYALPESAIVIDAIFESESCIVKIEMDSLLIEPYETDKIFQEKYKGRNARKLPGSGIGMFMTRRALRIMKADIEVQPQASTERTIEGKKYCKNLFLLKFPCRKSRP